MEQPYDFMVLPFVEIEIRLGTLRKNKFDSCVDRKYFEKIKETLEMGDWKCIINKNTVEYIKNNLKLITDINNEKELKNKKETGEKEQAKPKTNESKVELIQKERVKTEDFQISCSPFDIRYSLSQEFSLKSQIKTFDKTDCLIRNKSRKTFMAEDFKYDLTIVNENNGGILKTKYEIEIELLVNKNTLTWKTCYINDFLECKIYDLINIVEKIPREKIKINLTK